MNCPKCSATLVERGSFCKACGAQTRCLNCKDVLEPDAVACVECGTLIGQGKNGAGPVLQAEPVEAKRNSISYHEDRNSRTLTASLTDDAIGGMSESLAEFFVHRGAQRTTQHRVPATHEMVIDHDKALPPGDPAPPPPPSTPAETDDKVRIGKLFRENGQTLDLIDRRMKAKNGQEFTRRLTYLFLYAHELHGRFAVPRADVIAVLKEGKIWDSNASTWLNKKIGFKVDSDERMELLGEGRDEARNSSSKPSTRTSPTSGVRTRKELRNALPARKTLRELH
jgi:hypothetical protein